MLKPIPIPTVAASVPPDRERVYFEECSRIKFVPQATECNLCNAWWLAEASFAAYDTFNATGRGQIDLDPLLATGYSVTPGAAKDTQFLAIESKEVLIVAFRGTRLEGFSIPFLNTRGFDLKWGDVVTDARFLPVVMESNVFVHEGFLKAFRDIEDEFGVVVERALSNRRPVWFCGHSLGAALATLAAYKYRDRAQGLYTFGSPRVGNGSFANALISSLPNICRFVHHRDFVTTVPPEGLPISFDASAWLNFLNSLRDHKPVGYAHVGQLKFISGQKTWEIKDGESARGSIAAIAADAFAHAKEVADVLTHGFSITNPGSWPIAFDAVADHSPIYYTNKIFNASNEAPAAQGRMVRPGFSL
jgi:pimeloyl-ACP methyl ester carboxylesterase